MNDREITERIDELVAEEHRLEQTNQSGEPLSAEDRSRLERVEVSLDQCWDLLRQRRARRDAGMNPDDAEVRAASTVEHYQQ